MNKWLKILLSLVALGILVYFISINFYKKPSTSEVQIINPQANQIIKSPLLVGGMAKGTWFFEASLPVRLVDANGEQLFLGPAQALGEWMTEELVPFQINVEFSNPKTDTGTLIIAKDNPSGLPEHDKQFEVPVRFR